MRYFCCGSSVQRVVSVCMWSLAIWSAEYQLPIVLPVLFYGMEWKVGGDSCCCRFQSG